MSNLFQFTEGFFAALELSFAFAQFLCMRFSWLLSWVSPSCVLFSPLWAFCRPWFSSVKVSGVLPFVTTLAAFGFRSVVRHGAVTACPLCLNTFARYADRPVKDLAQVVLENTTD